MVEEKKIIIEQNYSHEKNKGRAIDEDLRSVFEDQLFYELFKARCHDTNEKPQCNQFKELR